MIFQPYTGVCHRGLTPVWACRPLSGAGAAQKGGRFNRPGVEALYLACSTDAALGELTQGAHRYHPFVLCCYEVDVPRIVDLTSLAVRRALKIRQSDLSCAWKWLDDPPSWQIADRLRAEGAEGLRVRSFAAGAALAAENLVLWRWEEGTVRVVDPEGRLPRDQLSWPS